MNKKEKKFFSKLRKEANKKSKNVLVPATFFKLTRKDVEELYQAAYYFGFLDGAEWAKNELEDNDK